MAAKDRTAGRAALERLGDTVADVLASIGLSEEELVDELVPTRRWADVGEHSGMDPNAG